MKGSDAEASFLTRFGGKIMMKKYPKFPAHFFANSLTVHCEAQFSPADGI
jgi:hypothetical protein